MDASTGSATAQDPAPALPGRGWRPRANPWAIAVVVALAAFMEVLDTSIANVALPHMAGSLAASSDQSTWILTSYLVANAIVLPITGWFAGVFGRRRFFLFCLAAFTASSLLCGIAPSLNTIILFRVLQGAGGGGLQPMAQAILADTFPPEKRGVAFAIFGVTTVLAPVVGPTLGGWITDNYSWRWIFYINLPVGILAILLVLRLVEDPPWVKRAAGAGVRIDYVGVGLLVVGVGALQIMLDRGQDEDWFGSPFIVTLAVAAAVGLVSLVVWEWFQDHPIVDVKLYRNVNFVGTNLMIFFLGIMLFSSLVLMPQFLQSLLGYTAESAGLVLSGGGVLLFLLFPVVGTLAARFQARYLIAFGWLALGLAMAYSARHLDLQISFWSASFLRITQVAGLPFLFVPINLAAYVGMPLEKSNSVAGLMNFMRNMGSSVGTSLVTTLIARRSQFHQLRLVEHARIDNPNFANAAQGLTQHFVNAGMGRHEASVTAYASMYRSLQAQAASLAYVDTFMVLCAVSAIMFFLAFFLEKNEPGGGMAVAG